jgi:DNA helicase HerA-like ATPase
VSDEITDSLRVCLVLEEAHSLAPEWNSTAHDGEKQAATATARAIMQGRKFGFGAIVVTQRTATVTKSILNQCNTVFAMRVYDQTGTEFLGNFIGSDYARLLANLKDRHAVVFGKASSCSSPLLVELNDRDDLAEWRAAIADEVRGDAEE